jgi:tRNA (adenine22-N1)-methyltransferase
MTSLPPESGQEKTPVLSHRLKIILSLLGKCRCLADIGTDHGMLPIFAVTSGKADLAIASDLRSGPLDRCRKNVELYGAAGKIDVRQGNGFENIDTGEADAAAICGMGGMLICEILSDALSRGKIAPGTKLLLSPNTHDEYVRRLLYGGPFEKIREKALRDSGRIYLAVSCVYTGGKPAFDPVSDGLKEPPYFRAEHFTGRDGKLPIYYYKKVLDKARKRFEGIKDRPDSREKLLLKEMIG